MDPFINSGALVLPGVRPSNAGCSAFRGPALSTAFLAEFLMIVFGM